MALEELSAIHNQERVTRLFPGRPRERDLAAEPPHALLEVRSGARSPSFFEELGARLDTTLEHGLCDPFTRICTIAKALEQDVDDRHAEPARAIREAAQRAETMTREILDFMRCVASSRTWSRAVST